METNANPNFANPTPQLLSKNLAIFLSIPSLSLKGGFFKKQKPVLCLLILLVTFILPTNVSTSSWSISGIY
jgi:hypothetical protein